MEDKMSVYDKYYDQMHSEKGMPVYDIDTMSNSMGTDLREEDKAIRMELGKDHYNKYWLGHGWLTRTPKEQGWHLIYTMPK